VRRPQVRILIVDDSSFNLLTLSMLLEQVKEFEAVIETALNG
jgi:CheY-like chemotaxis protein